jgi:hypothetical protein
MYKHHSSHKHRPSYARAGLAILLLALGVQRAGAQNICTAKPTPDGFVALRDAPSMKGRLIVRMLPDDMVVIDRDPGFPSGYMPVRSGQWLSASHFRGKVFPNPGDPAFSKVTKGWVHSSLVGDCG